MKYRLSNEAKEDLVRIYRYGFKKFGVVQADKYYNAFFDNFKRIANNPFQFPKANHVKEGYRYCVSGSDTIYFKLSENIVDIIAIIRQQDFN